jgi:hypothetical protein
MRLLHRKRNWRELSRGDKTDLNDILRQSGPEGPALLRQRISTSALEGCSRRICWSCKRNTQHERE